ncbi:hypothetical protein Salmuc_00806 [Salipiger mucosus DSM 16094]|uniref:N-acetyltransferase domain-containing protein n=1 Tax=Salipiger mucosus DSM 16094 TaxID=1123237 RepID=S9S716_9RHOB|nr:hypothetical protein Salmuc_00806 [Salipiger mucosus DSM 16094]
MLGMPSSREAALRYEIDGLKSDLRAFVAVALQHGLRDFCEQRYPDIVRELEAGVERSEERVERKYAKILAALESVPGLRATRGETGERTYYRNAVDDVAYLEHGLEDRRLVLNGIWVAPSYRGRGIAHRILRRLVEAADEADCGIVLYHEPFGDQGLERDDLEDFYNRHGFQRHEATPDGLFRFPKTPLDLYARHQG